MTNLLEGFKLGSRFFNYFRDFKKFFTEIHISEYNRLYEYPVKS